MRTSDQKPQLAIPNTQQFLQKDSNVVFSASSGSRAAFVTDGVTQIQGPTRLQYVPYQRTVIDYEAVETIQYVPVQRKVIEYEERKRIQQVPIEETVEDYYTVQHLTQYIPQIIPSKKIEYVPVQKIQNRVQYYPIERQVVYYPNQRHQYNSRSQFYQSQLNNPHLAFPSYSQHSRIPYYKSAYTHNTDIQRIQKYTSHTSAVAGKDQSYVSPIDFTRQNISPRVSGVSIPHSTPSNYKYQQYIKKSNASSKKSKHHHHGSKKKL